jgi:hypothetical protein
MSDMRLDAYYYGFTRTGHEGIDRILSAVACAGKAFHHTNQWTDEVWDGTPRDKRPAPYEPFLRGWTPVEWIQNAANDAAALLAAEAARREKGPLVSCPWCGVMFADDCPASQQIRHLIECGDYRREAAERALALARAALERTVAYLERVHKRFYEHSGFMNATTLGDRDYGRTVIQQARALLAPPDQPSSEPGA